MRGTSEGCAADWNDVGISNSTVRLFAEQQNRERAAGLYWRKRSGNPTLPTPGTGLPRMPDWREFEGQLLDGKYPLERYVGGDDESAVYLLGFVSTAARIRRAAAADADALVARWNRVKLIRHPHLLDIDAAGVSSLGGEPVAYMVGEHAEQNLAEILAERPLTVEETRDMLTQVGSALEHLHARGLIHGDLKAANILALGESVKVSSDSVTEGDPAVDIRALGFTLIHALTQREEAIAVNLPAPFGEIARGCLHPDPARRWTAGQVLGRLRQPDRIEPPLRAPVPARSGRRRFAVPIGLVAAGLALAGMVAIRRSDAPAAAPVEPPKSAAPVSPAPVPTPAPAIPEPKTEMATTRRPAREQSTRDRLATEDGVTERVVPNVPQSARNTIDGRPVVVVRVTVGPTGSVTDATVERTFSAYFSKLALAAARKWRFVPEESEASRAWVLRFQFTRAGTQVTARKAD